MAWQYHRRLSPVKAISFDLDDTLYENVPVMKRAEQHVADFIAQKWPQTSAFDVKAWRALRDQVAAEDAELASNMTALRLATLEKGLSQCGVKNAEQCAREAMEVFLVARNEVDIDAEVHAMLASLAAKYPLVAVSNGNADIHRIGLGDYFVGAFQPSDEHRGKPYSDLFQAAFDHLELKHPSEMLHIGDHPISDVFGALSFGAQAVWYSPNDSLQTPVWLPHASIQDVRQLDHILPS